jgi:hypothetical protein
MARPSLPPASSSPYRYLGRGGGERPFRFQLVIALIAGLVIVAVPLYLWRRPRPEPVPPADAAVASASARASATPPRPLEVAPLPSVTLSPFTTLKCENPGPGQTPPERCDHVAPFEDALARAIRETIACAPRSRSAVQITYLLDTDYKRKKFNIAPGKQSSVGPDRSRELLKCVRRAMAAPDWTRVPHQYAKYRVSVVATYPPNDGAPALEPPVDVSSGPNDGRAGDDDKSPPPEPKASPMAGDKRPTDKKPSDPKAGAKKPSDPKASGKKPSDPKAGAKKPANTPPGKTAPAKKPGKATPKKPSSPG